MQHKELIRNLVVRNLKIRYKGSALGFFWTFLNPLFMVLIYFLFVKIMRFKIDLSILLTGIMPWQFLVMCLNDSVNAVVGNANLVKKTNFPRVILPLSIVLANLVNFLLSLVVLFAFLAFLKIEPGAGLLCLPAVIALQTCLCFGLSLIVACSNVYFRDTEHIVSTVLMAWFFMTPIIYPLDLVTGSASIPQVLKNLYLLNPMASLVTAYRSVFLGAGFEMSRFIGVSLGISLVLGVAGYFVFRLKSPDFADVL